MIRAFRVMSLTGVLALGLGTMFSACSSGDTTDPPPPGYEGEFTLQRYLNVIPGNPPEQYLFAQARFFTTNLDLDAGGKLVMEGPGGELDMPRNEFLGRILYQKEQGTDIPPEFFVPGGAYSLRGSGSRRAMGVSEFTLDPVLTLPAAFTMTAPDCSTGLTIDGSSDMTFTWTPGDGEYVDLIVQLVLPNNTVYSVAYRSPDDGNYTWTTGSMATIPAGTGTITIIRIITTGPHVLPDLGTGEAFGGDGVTCMLTRQ